MPTSSSRSSSGSVASSCASKWIRRWNSSRCTRIEMYSPYPMENAPARRPASPATTMILEEPLDLRGDGVPRGDGAHRDLVPERLFEPVDVLGESVVLRDELGHSL